MKVKFWGTRGSLPAPCSEEAIRSKVFRALKMARGRNLSTDASIFAFMDTELPFTVRGTYGTNTSCVQILNDSEEFVLLDCGSGLRDFASELMRSGRARKPSVFHFFISHLHWDHIQGFPFFVPAFMPGHRIIFHSCHSETEAAFKNQMAPPYFPVPFGLLKADIEFRTYSPDAVLEVAGMEVCIREQRHPGKSYGYRFSQGGKSVVYSSDSEHKEDAYQPNYPVLEFFRGADLLIFDAMYSLAEATFSKADWGHSSNIMAVELAARAQVKKLALYHQEPTSSDDELDEFLFNSRMYGDVFYRESKDKVGPEQFPQEILLAYDNLMVEL